MSARFATTDNQVFTLGDRLDADGELSIHTDPGGTGYLNRVAARALRDHLTTVLGEEPAQTPESALRTSTAAARADAMKAAEEMVARLSTPPTNVRGYTVDGWKAPTLAERTAEILRVASFLLGGAQ